MKKFYLLIGAGAIMVSANAQRATSVVHNTLDHKHMKQLPATRATGDTVMFYDFDVYGGSGVDGTFAVATEDLDLNTPNNAGYDMDWAFFYSLAAWDFIPTDVNDTAFFAGATSWFNPAGQADNWLELGPITMPAGAAGTLSWYVKNNPSYRDAYEVLITTTGMSSGDFSDPNVYSRTDLGPVANPADTVWAMQTVNIPAIYNDQTIYIAFHHTANDMDVLYLDNFIVKEAPVSVGELENDFTMTEVFPNPMSNNASFNISLKNPSNVAYTITDLSGKVLLSKTENNKPAGLNRIEISADHMAAGMYYVNVTAGNTKLTKKIQVIK